MTSIAENDVRNLNEFTISQFLDLVYTYYKKDQNEFRLNFFGDGL